MERGSTVHCKHGFCDICMVLRDIRLWEAIQLYDSGRDLQPVKQGTITSSLPFLS